MTDNARRIPLGEIQHAALEHDIRVNPTLTEFERSHEKYHVLETYCTELVDKVHEHLEELHRLDMSKERTAQFKEEMMNKVNEHMEELEKEDRKKEEVARIKAELMERVHLHAEELEQLDAKRADLATYKAELLARAEEHMKDVELAREKGVQVRRFSLEMAEKIKQHDAHLAERANLVDTLKKEIITEARSYSNHGSNTV